MNADATVLRQPAWGRALLIAGGLHAAAAGALFLRFAPTAPPLSEMPAIAIELALPSAPPAPIHDAPTPRQIEAPKQTTPTPPQPKKLPFDPPPAQSADVAPEVVVPLAKEESPPTEKRNPLPPAPTTTELASPDMTKADTKTTALTTGGASAGATTAAERWDATVVARIQLTKRYPPLAQLNKQQDDVQVELTIDRTGQLRDAKVVSSRGYALLNDAAMEAVRRAAPFQKPPDEVEGDPIRISVLVHFGMGV